MLRKKTTLRLMTKDNEVMAVRFMFDKTSRNGNDMLQTFEQEVQNAVFINEELETVESAIYWTGGHAIRVEKD
jgi:hypothetical protein